MKHMKLYEQYKVTGYEKSFGFDIPIRTYLDNSFDHTVSILCSINGIGEKDFNRYDEVEEFAREYFDNNDEILLEIESHEQSGMRHELSGELIFHSYFAGFQNTNNISESLSDIKGTLSRAKKIPKEMKAKIEKYLNSDSRYNNGKVMNLTIPKVKGKSFDGVSLGADKNGFFVYTHRARCKSSKTIEQIPKNSIKFIKSTG